MKKLLFITAVSFCCFSVKAQTEPVKKVTIYDPSADAKADIEKAVGLASKEHKNVLLQIGGNWCGWCVLLNDKVNNDPELSKALHDNYELVHVNYSPENKNEKLLAGLGYPQRFGFPVLVVLDSKGNRIHTQNTSYLEEGHGHSKEKVMQFFKDWSPAAIDPNTYAKETKSN